MSSFVFRNTSALPLFHSGWNAFRYRIPWNGVLDSILCWGDSVPLTPASMAIFLRFSTNACSAFASCAFSRVSAMMASFLPPFFAILSGPRMGLMNGR